MSRSQRLLELLQLLRQYKYPIKGSQLASTLGISLRTLYRDIQTLQTQGVNIEGEAGLGYVLRPGYMLPPLMFSEEEIEALVLGMRWVMKRGDNPLQKAAFTALSKVEAVLPPALKAQLENSSLWVGPAKVLESGKIDLALIRETIRKHLKVNITYQDGYGVESLRTIWPFALAFFEQIRIIVAWCELRQDFRHFRFDRISRFVPSDKRYPENRMALLKAWQKKEGIDLSELSFETPDKN
jgi:predicted DNA-binding transcriptional regulator YafY